MNITNSSGDSMALREMGETIFAIMHERYRERGISGVRSALLYEIDGIPTIAVSLSAGGAYLLPQLPPDLRKGFASEYRRLVTAHGLPDLSEPSPFPEAIQITFAMGEYRKSRKRLSMIPIIAVHLNGHHIVCRGAWEPYEDWDNPEIEIPLNDGDAVIDICHSLLGEYLFGTDSWLAYQGRLAMYWLEGCADMLCSVIPNAGYCELAGDRDRHFGFLIMLNSPESLSAMRDGKLRRECLKMLEEDGLPNGHACLLLAGQPNPLNGSCMLSLHGPVRLDYTQMPETAWRALRDEPLWSQSINSRSFGPESLSEEDGGTTVFERKIGETACAVLNALGLEYVE